MDMTPSAHAILKDSVPQALDTLGFKDHAGVFRESDVRDVQAISNLLRNLPDPLEDVGFWAEAALWAALGNREQDFVHHSRMLSLAVQAVLLTALPQLAPQ